MVESIAEFSNATAPAQEQTTGAAGMKRVRAVARAEKQALMKRARTVASEAIEKMPTGKRYEKSFMHRDTVSHVLASSKHGMVFTGSVDGNLKFWKKGQVGIEFIKTFRAHLHKITGMALTPNEQRLATVSEQEQSVKLFDVLNFDVIHFFKLDFAPGECDFVSKLSSFSPILAIAELPQLKTEEEKKNDAEDNNPEDATSGVIRLVKVEQVSTRFEQNATVASTVINDLHDSQVRLIKFNQELDLVVSADQAGGIEIWDPETRELPEDGRLAFEMLSETDYYSLATDDTFAVAMEFSPDWQLLGVFGRDCKIRIFHFKSGRLLSVIDEGIDRLTEVQGKEDFRSDKDDGVDQEMLKVENTTEFQAKMSQYKDAMRLWDMQCRSALPSLVFDETSSLLVYSSPIGIKVASAATGACLKIYGKVEQGDFYLQLALLQGSTSSSSGASGAANQASIVKKQQLQAAALEGLPDPLILCSSFKKFRFYQFSRREPSDTEIDKVGRDLMNERLNNSAAGQLQQAAKAPKEALLPDKAVIYTSMGEIHLELYGRQCPLTVENFTTHAKNGYYDNRLFHRVVKGFMIQTGCPEGNGTGGESIWGGEFKDEFVPGLSHAEPGTLSMANCGKNTNAAQFFITTVPCSWLDNKHTVFGRVTKGMEVVNDIEKVRVDKEHKPLLDVKMHSIRVKQGKEAGTAAAGQSTTTAAAK